MSYDRGSQGRGGGGRYDDSNRGALFTNRRRRNDRDPEWTGKLMFNGSEYWISAWSKQGKNSGDDYISLSVGDKVDPNYNPAGRSGGGGRGYGDRGGSRDQGRGYDRDDRGQDRDAGRGYTHRRDEEPRRGREDDRGRGDPAPRGRPADDRDEAPVNRAPDYDDEIPF